MIIHIISIIMVLAFLFKKYTINFTKLVLKR